MRGLVKMANEYLAAVKTLGSLKLLEAAAEAQKDAKEMSEFAKHLYDEYLRSKES